MKITYENNPVMGSVWTVALSYSRRHAKALNVLSLEYPGLMVEVTWTDEKGARSQKRGYMWRWSFVRKFDIP